MVTHGDITKGVELAQGGCITNSATPSIELSHDREIELTQHLDSELLLTPSPSCEIRLSLCAHLHHLKFLR